ncbi:hypothetical protein [Inhella proteolytica]|uniref:Uncharacterized protein n=1 Tax=Inhella proteolytica TaxID=2795029 RepID=A0A931IYP0_9BURK|nr:hypothetical protein [Inhella proteolytica]MBH9576189.1 hypothetical protein [Inhella proteolytica]
MSAPRLLLTLLLALCLGLQGGLVRAASLAAMGEEGASAQAVPPCHETAAHAAVATDAVDAANAALPDAGCSHCANCCLPAALPTPVPLCLPELARDDWPGLQPQAPPQTAQPPLLRPPRSL